MAYIKVISSPNNRVYDGKWKTQTDQMCFVPFKCRFIFYLVLMKLLSTPLSLWYSNDKTTEQSDCDAEMYNVPITVAL